MNKFKERIKMYLGKKQQLSIIGCLLVSATAIAQNSDSNVNGYYIKPYLGISKLSDSQADITNHTSLNGAYDLKQDTGFAAGLAFGYQYNSTISVELAWEYLSNETKIDTQQLGVNLTGDNTASNLLLLNGYYTFANQSNLSPYLGAGIGWLQELDVDIKQNGREQSFSDSGLAFQIMAGVRYPITQHWHADLQLRYLKATLDELDAESGAGKLKNVDYDPVTFQLGIVYLF
jgi:opacity protein-like surface antigen